MATASRNSRKSSQEADSASEPPRLQEVLDVAGRLFHEKGYRSTSLADIGDALGMNKASLYYYVGSKEELVRKLILRAARRLRDVSQQPGIADMKPDLALESLVREHCELILRHPSEIALLIQQRRFVEPTALEEIVQRERAYVASMRAIISRGVQDGTFRAVDAGVATQLVLDCINGLLRWFRPRGRLSGARAVDEVWDFVRAGLCAPTRSRAARG